jgi:L-lactate dehydrogenase complex protein LldG
VSGRDEVLARIRNALASGGGAVEVPRAYRQRSERAGDELIDLLMDRLTDYRAFVHRAPEDGVAGTVATVLAEVSGRATVVTPPGLPAAWLPPGIDAVPDDGLGADRLAAVDAVVTAAAVAVAETGTIVLDGSPDQGRRIITLLPDLHICVIRPDQVVAGVPEALERLDPRRPLTWISGPSATSDIELDRVEGVHGPRRLHVIIANSRPG